VLIERGCAYVRLEKFKREDSFNAEANKHHFLSEAWLALFSV
jgi:hypothetical protein